MAGVPCALAAQPWWQAHDERDHLRGETRRLRRRVVTAAPTSIDPTQVSP